MKLQMHRKGEINEMREGMEGVCEKICVFEDSTQIDFDFEFDVAKFFDFTRVESPEEIEESESWFEFAEGHAPSPLVAKLGWRTDEVSESETCSSMYGRQSTSSTNSYIDLCGAYEDSSLSQGKTGKEMFKSKTKSSSQEHSRISRLLKPTASHLAKQNQQIGVCSTTKPGRPQKLQSPLKSPGENVASKRQKLDINYLCKVAQLRHRASFSHKLPKQRKAAKSGSPQLRESRMHNGSCCGIAAVVSSPARPKVTIPKEPALRTAQRAQRHRSINAAQPDNHSRPSSSSTNASLEEKSDPDYRFKARSFNKKIFSSKGDIGVFRTSKREVTVPREFKLSNSRKLSQNPPTELFSKLSLNSENQPGSLPEEKQRLQNKGLKKNRTCSIMKENKIPESISGKSRISCLKQSQLSGGNMMSDIGNHPTSARSFIIH